MSSERVWIVLLACVCFLGGVAGGILWAPMSGGSLGRTQGQFASYEAWLSETFELDQQQRSDLRFILDEYERETDDLRARQVREFETEYVRLGETCCERIREYVLSPDKVARFDEMAGIRGDAPLSPQ